MTNTRKKRTKIKYIVHMYIYVYIYVCTKIAFKCCSFTTRREVCDICIWLHLLQFNCIFSFTFTNNNTTYCQSGKHKKNITKMKYIVHICTYVCIKIPFKSLQLHDTTRRLLWRRELELIWRSVAIFSLRWSFVWAANSTLLESANI